MSIQSFRNKDLPQAENHLAVSNHPDAHLPSSFHTPSEPTTCAAGLTAWSSHSSFSASTHKANLLAQLHDCLAVSPVMAAVRNMDDLALALQSPVRVISMMGGTIGEIAQITASIHDHGKMALFHPELVKGLGRDQAGIDYLARIAAPDGIISTKPHILRAASQLGLISILQIFMIDTQAFETGLENITSLQPDAVEIMPAIMPRMVSCVKASFSGPVLAAGLVKTPHDVDSLLKVGTAGIAVSEKSLWNFASKRPLS